MKVFKRLVALTILVYFSHSVLGQSVLKKADKQYELSDYANAIVSYTEVLDKQPLHLDANSRIADAYRHLNQLDKALSHYQTAVNQQGVKDIYVFQYGLTLQELGRYDQARQVFDRLASNSAEFRTRARQFSEACAFATGLEEPGLYKVTNEYLNTKASDFGPALFKGERIVYSSSRNDINDRNNRNAPTSTTSKANKLFITQRDKNGFLETPATLHSGFGNGTNEGPVSYSPDGKWAAITKNSFSEGIRQIPSSGQEMSLHIAQCNANGDWTNMVPFPNNVTGYSTGYPAFSADGKALYFSSNRPGGFGGYDLYISYRTGNGWSAPENLGAAINSIGNEITPFHDGTSLFFASDYHRGYGGFDIFRAEESAGKWATLYHTGPDLNSSSDDYGFIYDPIRNFGYFVSNRPGGKGLEDIYRVVKESETVVLKVMDAATGKPIPNAVIDFSNCGDKSYSANANGVFNFQIIDNLDCQISIGKTGYFNKQLRISSVSLKLNRNIEVALTNENSAYRGKILTGTDGVGLERVKIITTNQNTGESVESFSSANGEYFVSVLPNTNYTLRFSKAGYVDVNLNFQSSQSDNNQIRNVEMMPVGSTALPVTNRFERAASPAPSAPSNTLNSGFAIQLAAVSSANVDLKAFRDAVDNDGNVYSTSDRGLFKVRVGIYPTRAEAERVQNILKTRGYPGAFIVSESNVQVPIAVAPTREYRSTEISTRSTTKPTTSKSELSGYLIRLTTLTDLKFFNDEKIQDVGIINRVVKGPYTIILLSGYDTMTSAEEALTRAKAKGFPEAYIVTEDGGEFRKVK